MSTNKINPKKGEALYLQIKDVLINRIQNGAWKPNTLIPTEQELIKEFNVSRTTIRQAISILVQNGLLEKKQGRGTIVKSQRLVGNLGKLRGFAEEVVERGQTPHSKLLRAEFKEDLYHEMDMLGVKEGEAILLVERIRFADEIPIALERTCWPKEVGELLIECDLNQARYYEVLEQYNYYLKSANERITAINATINEADSLGIRPGEALLEMTRLSFGVNDHPIEYTKTKYRSDKYHYNIELER
ncbi:GntR family transcriptional regulator [Pseudalkalibacillus decolorationis]|uniref:GntR family transcriptional regulator n=1 Tax=Pseudalkalibacillus decolorationis TaxID=163879 RepID=UPI0021487075|nr:GntR family transcriptional regulator [Pseudalkalibacillus decolorationis]